MKITEIVKALVLYGFGVTITYCTFAFCNWSFIPLYWGQGVFPFGFIIIVMSAILLAGLLAIAFPSITK